MDAFYGTWKVQLDKTTGVQEFGKLFGWTDEKISQFLSMEYTLQVQATADGTRCIVDYGVVKLEFSFKLGEPFDYTGVDGLKAKAADSEQVKVMLSSCSLVDVVASITPCTPTLDGGKLLETFQTDAGIAWKTVREVSGSTMTAVTSLVGNDNVKCIQVFQKV